VPKDNLPTLHLDFKYSRLPRMSGYIRKGARQVNRAGLLFVSLLCIGATY
jgi:hypothetical protein